MDTNEVSPRRKLLKNPAVIIGLILVVLCMFSQLGLQFGTFPGESGWGASILVAYLYLITIIYVIVLSLFLLIKSFFTGKPDVVAPISSAPSTDGNNLLVAKLAGLVFFLFMFYLVLAVVYRWPIPFVIDGIR